MYVLFLLLSISAYNVNERKPTVVFVVRCLHVAYQQAGQYVRK